MNNIIKYSLITLIGGILYWCLEATRKLLVIGIFFTSPWMILIGGLSVLGIYLINKYIKTNIIYQSLISGLWITSLEFIFGGFFTYVLHSPLWTYGTAQFLGIISFTWSLLWCGLSFIAIIILNFIKKYKKK